MPSTPHSRPPYASADAPLVVSVTVLAEPGPTGRVVTRSGARPGDMLCVTGTLGGGWNADGSGSQTSEVDVATATAHRIAPTFVGPLQHDSARWSRLAPNPPTAKSRSSGSSRSNTFRPST